MPLKDSLKRLYILWPLKEKSGEDVGVFKYLRGIQVKEGIDLISVTS